MTVEMDQALSKYETKDWMEYQNLESNISRSWMFFFIPFLIVLWYLILHITWINYFNSNQNLESHLSDSFLWYTASGPLFASTCLAFLVDWILGESPVTRNCLMLVLTSLSLCAPLSPLRVCTFPFIDVLCLFTCECICSDTWPDHAEF
jgi:hypothetical protein